MSFGLTDYLIVLVYFAGMLGIGAWFARREKSTDSYFVGGRRIPWWAAGLSIFGSSISSITYLAIPAKAYSADWVTMLGNFSIFIIAPLVVYYYIPAFRRVTITTAYEYLETRFNLAISLYGSLAFILYQVGRIAIVMYLPAMVLSTVTGLDIRFSVLTMGLITTIYTMLGGIEAVIWTDVIQCFVLMGGAGIALFLVIHNIEGGLPAMLSTAYDAGKLHTFNWTWSPSTPAVWVCLFGNAFALMYPSTACQTIVQRYLSTATERDAARAVWVNAWLTIPVSFFFFGLGSALWVYYEAHREMVPADMRNDGILPLFVMQHFPIGLRSTLLAGVFAAAMSALSSSINSMATVFVNDYYQRFWPNVTDAKALRAARILTVITGVSGTAMALYVATLNVTSIFDQWLQLLGLIGGGLSGIVALGIFTTRANDNGATVGAVASAVVMAYVYVETDIHYFLYGMIGFCTAYGVGYGASFLFNAKQLTPRTRV